MPSRHFSLQTKIAAIVSVTVISVVVVSTLTAMVLTRQLVEEEIYRKALAQAMATAQQLVNEHTLTNSEGMLRALRRMQADFPSVEQCDVYLHGPAHHLVSTTNPGAQHQELDNTPDIEDFYEFERPNNNTITIETEDGSFWIIGTTIRDRDGVVGCLNMKVSKSRSSAVTYNLVLRNLLLMLASLAVVFGVIHVFFLRNVRAPMREMMRAMESAEAGDLGERARVANHDETGELAEHLNQMLDRLQHFNSELSRKVEEATRELAQRYEELQRINEELFETQKKLAHSERLAVAGQLAASLAHEIGTPLNSISGHVQLLARQKTGDEVADRRFQIIETQIENIVRSVKQLLAWTHRLDLQLAPVDLRRLLEESVLLSSPTLQLRGIGFRTEYSDDVPQILADGGYLRQVFLNLINNSMDAMPHGGRLEFRVHVSPENRKEIIMEVEDTGEGIAAETLTHIFEPMFTTKRMGSGSGLGLAVCNQIIRQHGGSIQVSSEIGKGTSFTIILPVGNCEGSEIDSEAASATVSSGKECISEGAHYPCP